MTELVSALLYFLKDLLKTACLIEIGRSVFTFPQKKRRFLPACLLLLLAAAAVIAVFPESLSEENRRMAADSASFLLCVGLPLSLAQSPGRQLISYGGAALLLDFTADTLYSLVASIGGDALWWESTFGALFYGMLLAFLRLSGKRGDMGYLSGSFRTVPKWAWAALLFFEFTCYYRTFGEALSWYNAFSAVAVISVLLTLFFLIFRLVRTAERQTDILRLQRSDEELRAFRHDYKNHLVVIRSYLESGNTEAAKAYFDSIGTLSPEALRQTGTGNFAADALIGYKLRAAEEKGVRFTFEGRIPSSGIRDEDLCTILSNLLDNAVEAAAPLEGEKEVHIEAIFKNNFLLLCITNPTGNAPQNERGTPDSGTPGGKYSDGRFAADLPTTTKADKKNHGYGLKNVRIAVNKYGGSFTATKENDTFTASVRIKIMEKDAVNSAI